MRENGTGGTAWAGAAGFQKVTENDEHGWILPFAHITYPPFPSNIK